MKIRVFMVLAGFILAGLMAGCEKDGSHDSAPDPDPAPAPAVTPWVPFIGHWRFTMPWGSMKFNAYVTDLGKVQVTEGLETEYSYGIRDFALGKWIPFDHSVQVKFEGKSTVLIEEDYGYTTNRGVGTRHCRNFVPNLAN